jgi:hypothetical protein
MNDGIWILHGFVADQSREEAGTGYYRKVINFGAVSFGCVPHSHTERGNHDYFDIRFRVRPDLPENFQGMSGGGLWQIELVAGAIEGQVAPRQMPLSGMAFYQGPVEDSHSCVRCHGRRSLYEVVYEALTKH